MKKSKDSHFLKSVEKTEQVVKKVSWVVSRVTSCTSYIRIINRQLTY